MFEGLKPRIAIVDDDPVIVESFADQFSEEFQVLTFISPIEALLSLPSENVSAVIADFRMPKLDGIKFLAQIRHARPNLTRILFTAFADLDCLSRAINEAGIFHYIAKERLGIQGAHAEIHNVIHWAVDLTRLREEREQLLRRLTDQNELLREENEKLHRQRPRALGSQTFSDLIGQSSAIKEVIQRAEQAAGLDFPVLIYGETGTGKEIVSRAIHFEGKRKHQPFIAINCGAIQKDLLTSELMGYTKGAFTGASENKRGLVEMADKGSLFLDEIGDMPLDAQPHLLRFLDTCEVRPIGSSLAKRFDVRIIAATNRDLKKDVEEGRFRDDLYRRLDQGINLRLPPLRARLDDLPLLVTHILQQEHRNGTAMGISSEALQVLKNYTFPGNLRELIGMIRKAFTEALLSGENILLPSHFPVGTLPTHERSRPEGWKAATNQFKRAEIEQALKKCNTITAAASHLGVTREGLSRSMKSLGIRNLPET